MADFESSTIADILDPAVLKKLQTFKETLPQTSTKIVPVPVAQLRQQTGDAQHASPLDRNTKKQDETTALHDIRKALAGIRKTDESLSDDERRDQIKERLQEVKEALARQEEGLRITMLQVRKAIEDNPDITFAELEDYIRENAAEYGLTNWQVTRFEDVMNSYEKKHAAVEEISEEYPNDTNLFEACFDKKPQGLVKVYKGPMTLHFLCADEQDYIDAACYGNDTEEKLRYAHWLAVRSIGLSLPHAKRKELKGTITLEKGIIKRGEDGEVADVFLDPGIYEHEEQHQLNGLFRPLEAEEDYNAIIRRAVSSGRSLDEITYRVIYGLARYERAERIDKDAKDELLAHLQNHPLYDIYQNMLRNYRYADDMQEKLNEIPFDIQDIIQEKMSIAEYTHDKENQPTELRSAEALYIDVDEIRPVVEKVFYEEYDRDLRKWVDAMEVLKLKGYSHEEITAMLYAEPISHWYRYAQRTKPKGQQL